MSNELLNRTFAAIGEIVEGLGYECVNVALASEDRRPVLRVLIDSIGGINTGDCETVSKAVNRYLDEPDADEDAELGDRYYLEVSSPGLERPLFTPADYARFAGREARIKTGKLVDGRKIHVGFITASDGDTVILDTEQGARVLPFADITRAALVFKGLEPQAPKNTKKRNGKQYQMGKTEERTGSKTAIDEGEH